MPTGPVGGVAGGADRASLDAGNGSRIEIVLAGDLYFGEMYQSQLAAEGGRNVLAERGYDFFLTPFREFLASANAVVVNLETPLTWRTDSPFTGIKGYIHAGEPSLSVAAMQRAGIGGVLLGNNHVIDQGPAGVGDTLDVLDAAGIKWTGGGRNSSEAVRPLTISGRRNDREVTVIVFSAYQFRPQAQAKFSMYATPTQPGVADLREMPRAIARARAEAPEALIVASPHWGENYRWRLPWQDQVAAALFAAGADVVIGHGAHMLQEIGRIGRNWTIHSIGNFVFLSRGRHAQFGAPPYSLLARLIVDGGRRYDDFLLRLYPIITNNEMTDFHPRFVDDQEFRDVLNMVAARSPALAHGARDVWSGRDGHGAYIEMRVR